MDVDEIQRQVTKFQRVSSNGSTTTTDNSSNPNKIATRIGNFELQNHGEDGRGTRGGGGGGEGGIDVVVGGGGVARLCGWPASRIVRVSRASGGKDRHSKVLTSKGLRDRRVRLSVGTAIQFYDLQDRLGYDQPSKAVEWLLKAASSSIDELPSLDLPIVGSIPDHHYHHHQKKVLDESNNLEDRSNPPQENNNNNNSNATTTQAKSPVCSSTSETSKGSELSLSRADENRSKARERARGLTSSKKEREKKKEKQTDSTRVNMLNQVNNNNSISDNSSFTDLLTGGINVNAVTTAVRSPMEYFFNRVQQTPSQLFQLPQFSLTNGDNNINDNNNNNNNSLHQFSFLQQDNLNNSFSMTSPSPSSGGVAPGGYTRGTLQSNLPLSVLPHHHHHHLQRFQQSAIDGSNIPFFVVPNGGVDHHFPAAAGGYHFSYGGGGDHHKDKAKN